MADKNSLRRAIFAACRNRGLDDDARHELQKRVTGKASMTAMDENDMRALLNELNGRGGSRRVAQMQAQRRRFPATMDELRELDEKGMSPHVNCRCAPPEPKPQNVLPDGPWVSKLRALWRSAYWLGVVRNNGDAALAAWIVRQTGYGSARWATPGDSDRLIDAMKSWMAREVGVDWSPYDGRGKMGRPKQFPAARVLEALWRRLHEYGEIPDGSPETLAAWVRGFRRSPGDYVELNVRTQNKLIRELGRWRWRAEP